MSSTRVFGDVGGSIEVDSRRLALAQVSMTDRRSLDLLLESFGGTLKLVAKEGARPIWVWRVCHKTAKLLLEAILPYLIVKKYQAELLIDLENGIPRRGVHRRLNDREIERRRKLQDKICALNGPSLYAEYLKSMNE